MQKTRMAAHSIPSGFKWKAPSILQHELRLDVNYSICKLQNCCRCPILRHIYRRISAYHKQTQYVIILYHFDMSLMTQSTFFKRWFCRGKLYNMPSSCAFPVNVPFVSFLKYDERFCADLTSTAFRSREFWPNMVSYVSYNSAPIPRTNSL